MTNENEGKFQITVKRIVHAKPWQVLRRVMRINDFSSYMPNVKESRVIGREGWKFKTQWAVEADGIPIRWIEEETVDIKNATIQFHAIEGDLPHFDGCWRFTPCGAWTEVEIQAEIQIAIPYLGQAIETILREKIGKNFILMLEAMNNALVSERYLNYRKGVRDAISGFAIIGHPYNLANLIRYLKFLSPQFKTPSPTFLSKIYELMPAYAMHDIETFKSAAGVESHGLIVVSTFVPDMLAIDLEKVVDKVVEACHVAESHRIGIAALGGFTSIAGEKFGSDLQKRVHIPLTTGNTFTVSLALDGIYKACRLMEIDLNKATVCVIGGTGDIGGGCARILSEQVEKIIVTGRSASRVQEAQNFLKAYSKKAVILGTENNLSAIKDADIVIAAASATQSILDMTGFKPGAVICDLAYPKNISHVVCSRDDILIFSGGLAEIPQPIEMGFEIGLPAPNTLYGCFSEAILLDLEKRYESFSYGKGNITKEKVAEIKQIADRQGFRVAPFYWGDQLITEERIAQIRRAALRGQP